MPQDLSDLKPAGEPDYRFDAYQADFNEQPLLKVQDRSGREYYLKPVRADEAAHHANALETRLGPDSIIRYADMRVIQPSDLPPAIRDYYPNLGDKKLVFVEAVPFDGRGIGALLDPETKAAVLKDKLGGKPITAAEQAQLFTELETLVKNGAIHGDMPNNVDIRRVEGKLQVFVIDPSPGYAAKNPFKDITELAKAFQDIQKNGLAEPYDVSYKRVTNGTEIILEKAGKPVMRKSIVDAEAAAPKTPTTEPHAVAEAKVPETQKVDPPAEAQAQKVAEPVDPLAADLPQRVAETKLADQYRPRLQEAFEEAKRADEALRKAQSVTEAGTPETQRRLADAQAQAESAQRTAAALDQEFQAKLKAIQEQGKPARLAGNQALNQKITEQARKLGLQVPVPKPPPPPKTEPASPASTPWNNPAVPPHEWPIQAVMEASGLTMPDAKTIAAKDGTVLLTQGKDGYWSETPDGKRQLPALAQKSGVLRRFFAEHFDFDGTQIRTVAQFLTEVQSPPAAEAPKPPGPEPTRNGSSHERHPESKRQPLSQAPDATAGSRTPLPAQAEIGKLQRFLQGGPRPGFGAAGNAMGLHGGVSMLLHDNEALPDSIRYLAGTAVTASSGAGLAADAVAAAKSSAARAATAAGRPAAAAVLEAQAASAQKLAGNIATPVNALLVPLDIWQAAHAFNEGKNVEGAQHAAGATSGTLFLVSQFAAQGSRVAAFAGPAGVVIAIGAASASIVANGIEINRIVADTNALGATLVEQNRTMNGPGITAKYQHYFETNQGRQLYRAEEPSVSEYRNFGAAKSLANTLNPPAERIGDDSHPDPAKVVAAFDKAKYALEVERQAILKRTGQQNGWEGAALAVPEMRNRFVTLAFPSWLGGASNQDINRLNEIDAEMKVLQSARLEIGGDKKGEVPVEGRFGQAPLLSYSKRRDMVARAKSEYAKVMKDVEPQIPDLEKAVASQERADAEYRTRVDALKTQFEKSFASKPSNLSAFDEAKKKFEALSAAHDRDKGDKLMYALMLNAQADLLKLEPTNLVHLHTELAKRTLEKAQANKKRADDPALANLEAALKAPVQDPQLDTRRETMDQAARAYAGAQLAVLEAKEEMAKRFGNEERQGKLLADGDKGYLEAAKNVQRLQDVSLARYIEATGAETAFLDRREQVLKTASKAVETSIEDKLAGKLAVQLKRLGDLLEERHGAASAKEFRESLPATKETARKLLELSGSLGGKVNMVERLGALIDSKSDQDKEFIKDKLAASPQPGAVLAALLGKARDDYQEHVVSPEQTTFPPPREARWQRAEQYWQQAANPRQYTADIPIEDIYPEAAAARKAAATRPAKSAPDAVARADRNQDGKLDVKDFDTNGTGKIDTPEEVKSLQAAYTDLNQAKASPPKTLDAVLKQAKVLDAIQEIRQLAAKSGVQLAETNATAVAAPAIGGKETSVEVKR